MVQFGLGSSSDEEEAGPSQAVAEEPTTGAEVLFPEDAPSEEALDTSDHSAHGIFIYLAHRAFGDPYYNTRDCYDEEGLPNETVDQYILGRIMHATKGNYQYQPHWAADLRRLFALPDPQSPFESPVLSPLPTY